MKDDPIIVDPSWWRLQADVAWGRVLLSIVSMREGVKAHPEVYLFLGNRYWWLARRHFVRHRPARAQRLVGKARFYFRHGGGPEPPPLAAASMPIPDAPSLTSAIGMAGGGGRNDAA